MENENLGNSNSRRKFLTRATAGAVLATIPAKSVWATGLTNSIVASGHGSDFAGGKDIKLKSPTAWLSSGASALAYIYAGLSQASPVINWKLARCFSGKENELFLCHLLGDKGELTNFITSKLKGKVGRYTKNGQRYHIKLYEKTWNKTKTHRYTWAELIEHLGAEEGVSPELNMYIVSAYLNAKYSGQFGIHYPIVNSYNGAHAPYPSAEAFLTKLHHAAKSHPTDTLRMLKVLHTDPSSLRTFT